jgi:transcriptional regulator with XRE-family HTH domain
MPSVGQRIREQRLRLGLTLEDISGNSRIPLKTLQAIESDDLSRISSPFLYKSFVRQFAGYLGLDVTELAVALDSAALSMPQPLVPGEGDLGRTSIRPMPVKGQHKNFRWVYSITSFALVLVTCSAVYGTWQASKYTWWSQVDDLLHSGKAQKSTDAVPPGVAVAPAFRVELSALERTWLSIVEDGKQTFSGILDPDQTKVLEGHNTARIRMQNAGGISCVFNGKAIGILGERGQARTVVFTKTNYKVLDPGSHFALIILPIDTFAVYR